MASKHLTLCQVNLFDFGSSCVRFVGPQTLLQMLRLETQRCVVIALWLCNKFAVQGDSSCVQLGSKINTTVSNITSPVHYTFTKLMFSLLAGMRYV